jgi:hypothetical protein
MGIAVDNLTETGHVLAWMGADGVRLHWVVAKFSKALGRWENYDEARARTWIEAGAPDDAMIVNEADLPDKAARSTAIIRDGRVVAAPAWRVSQWQAKVSATLDRADALGGPRALREAMAASAPRLARIEAWAKALRGLTWSGEGDEPRIPQLDEFAEPDRVSEVEPAQHFADLMLADETADDARVRLSQRLRELRHYLMAPEIKVNEDGSVGLTPGEQSELQDLERRQTLGRWLDA